MSDITRTEAIKQLRLLKADIINGLSFISKTKDKHPALDSLDMAIESLETDEAYQLEYEQPELCVDCISRKAAIQGLGEQPYAWTDSDFEIQQIQDWKSTKEMLENLPSILPKATKNDLGVDAISRQAVLVAMRNNYRDGGRDIDGDYIEGNYSEKLYDAITSLPTVTPQEPKIGHWIPVYQGDEIINYRCSECEFGNTFGKGTFGMNFCPRCGADMREVET